MPRGAILMSPSEYSEDISYYLTSDIDSADFNNGGFADLEVTVTNLRLDHPKKTMP